MAKTQKLMLLGILGLLILMIASFAGIKYSSRSSFCSSCHIMDNNYSSWQQSTHKSVDCLKCHAEPGLMGTLKVKLNGVKQVVSTMFNLVDKPGKAHISNNTCTLCHNQNNKELSAKLDNTREERTKTRHLSFDHPKHNQLDFQCTSCHIGVGHSDKIDPKQVMKTCLDCHAKKLQENKDAKVPKANNCVSCHTKVEEIIPKNHQPKEKWALVHGASALKNTEECKLCHQFNFTQGGEKQPAVEANVAVTAADNKDFCHDCHKTVIPHQQNYLQGHAKEYQANLGICNKCHQQGAKPTADRRANNCSDCHKLPMPHPGDFVKSHGSIAKADSNNCMYCHSDKNPVNPTAQYTTKTFCNDCHLKNNPHKANWKNQHKSEAKKNIASCSTCHAKPGTSLTLTNYNAAKTFCNDCHTKINPHKASWKDQHKAPAIKNIASCSTCHAKPGTSLTLTNYKQNSLCAKCHVNNPHPSDWVATHKQSMATKGSTCNSCHKQQNFCSKCHG